jgi:hypothetical protein
VLVIGLNRQITWAQFNQRQFSSLEKSVVRVLAENCTDLPGKTLAGSGFLWKQSRWVATALHVVNKCSNVTVVYGSPSTSTGARVTKIETADDLVLLTLDSDLAGAIPLLTTAPAPQDTQDLLLLGFPDDSSGITGKSIHRQFGASTLDDLVSSQARQELKESGSPRLTTSVIFLSASMEHGHSGGPIFNQSGNLVGIADGGLKHGATEDSWAIPSSDLAELEASGEPLQAMSKQKSSLLFTAQRISAPGPAINCGGGNFGLLKTITLAEISKTADDPNGFAQLVVASGINTGGFSFDVYQDPDTRAAIVLPAGESLSGDVNECTASNSDSTVLLRSRVIRVTNDP